MQIVENWSRVTGVVRRWEPPRESEAPGMLTLLVERVEPVASGAGATYANLLAGTEGQVIRVQIPAVAAAALHVSDRTRLALDVRRGRQPSKFIARAGGIEQLEK